MWTSLQPRNWYRWKRAAAMTTRNHHTPFSMRRRLRKSQFMGQREGEWNSSMYDVSKVNIKISCVISFCGMSEDLANQFEITCIYSGWGFIYFCGHQFLVDFVKSMISRIRTFMDNCSPIIIFEHVSYFSVHLTSPNNNIHYYWWSTNIYEVTVSVSHSKNDLCTEFFSFSATYDAHYLGYVTLGLVSYKNIQLMLNNFNQQLFWIIKSLCKSVVFSFIKNKLFFKQYVCRYMYTLFIHK